MKWEREKKQRKNLYLYDKIQEIIVILNPEHVLSL